MIRYDASNAECLVLTRKEGLLSAVAHDLKLELEDFSIERDLDPPAVRGRFVLASLCVRCAMQGGEDAPRILSEDDKQKIEENTRATLEAGRWPEAVFTSTSIEGERVSGTLALHGEERPISFRVREQGDRLVAEVALRQPDFGIKPFTAMMGALKVHPEVTVVISVPKV